jgi:hypothetical protein
VTSLSNGDQYTAIAVIEKRVNQLLKASAHLPDKKCCKTMIVRVNSREKCEILNAILSSDISLSALWFTVKLKAIKMFRRFLKLKKFRQGRYCIYNIDYG